MLRWIHAGLLPVTRMGLRTILIDPDDLALVKRPFLAPRTPRATTTGQEQP